MKVNFTFSYEVENRDELVKIIINTIDDGTGEPDMEFDDYQHVIPENWQQPESWSDDDIKEFLSVAGGLFLSYNVSECLEEIMNCAYNNHIISIEQ